MLKDESKFESIIEILKSDREVFELFAKKEEYDPPKLDDLERFSYFLSKHSNIIEPRASQYLVDNGYHIEYPDRKKFAVCLTHDIDRVYPRNLGIAYYCLSYFTRLKIQKAVMALLCLKNKKYSPYLNFESIMNLEEKYEAKSSFFFMTASMDLAGKPNYQISDVDNELHNILDRGWEIGLHGGYYSYNSLKDIVDEKRTLEDVIGKQVVGYRNHYLRFTVPNSWIILQKANFLYDTTFGYSDHIGFRNGMCHPFKPFNLVTNREIDIVEIPLHVMDVTLFSAMNVSEAWDRTRQLIDIVKANSGVLTILWHNTNALHPYNKLYERILKYCYEQDAWMTSGQNVCKHLYSHNI
jgi:peptidoglycan/xylan/chitin deacetylase (PgdA/CDA1 family)